MNQRLLVIGIDSLDPAILENNKNRLPTFRGLADETPRIEMSSVFPIDTVPAWSTIHTGLNPANHGLLYSYDVFDPKLRGLISMDGSRTRGMTFWDYASGEGKRCAVIFPMLAFPPWPINGLMISRSPMESRIDPLRTLRSVISNPLEALGTYEMDAEQIDLWGGYPGLKSLREWSEVGGEVLASQARAGLRILNSERWDLFFIYFHILDVIQHRLWRFHDKSDPLYEDQPTLRSIVSSFYIQLDNILSRCLEGHDDLGVIVLSDHGHRSRPYMTVNVNELLRRQGHITGSGQHGILKGSMGLTGVVEGILDKLEIEHVALRLVTANQLLASAARKMLYPSSATGETNDTARLSTFLGVKSYSCGGVSIQASHVPPDGYDCIRMKIINELRLLVKRDSTTPVMKWVCTREQLYPDGKFTKEILPDIVFQLDDEYSVGWDIGGEVFGHAQDHKIASGGHSGKCVFLHRNLGRRFKRTNLLLPDVAPTILDAIGIDPSRYRFDGKSAFRD